MEQGVELTVVAFEFQATILIVTGTGGDVTKDLQVVDFFRVGVRILLVEFSDVLEGGPSID